MSDPDVTIVIATYNRPEMLDVMVGSVRLSATQVLNRVRVLVVDDCSDTMAAKDVAKRHGVDYRRLRENRGVAGALYAGFQGVDSELYALWGDDDYFLIDWFRQHLAKMAEGFDVVAGSYWKTDSNLRRTTKHVLPVATLAELRKGNVTCNDGALVRTASVDPAWFRPERERAMMMTFWLSMAAAGRKFGVVKKPTWLYRRHAGQLSERRPSLHDMELRRAAMAEYA